MLAGRDDDAEPRAGRDVDVRIDAPLADQPELRQSLEQRRLDPRAFADEDQGFRVSQPMGQRVDILDMIVPDRDIMACEHAEARQAPQRVVIVVENRNVHRRSLTGVTESISWTVVRGRFAGRKAFRRLAVGTPILTGAGGTMSSTRQATRPPGGTWVASDASIP